MDAIEVLKTRRSVRAYERKTVPKAIIEEIIDCGRLAASANNAQPWEFLVVTDPDMLRRIAKAKLSRCARCGSRSHWFCKHPRSAFRWPASGVARADFFGQCTGCIPGLRSTL